MADQPTHGLEVLEWLKIIGGAAATAFGTAWSFLRGSQAELQARVNEMSVTQAAHQTDIAVLKATTDNHVERLDEIREFAKEINASVKELSGQLTDLLITLKQH